MMNRRNRALRAGTSMIELLVVIVIFLIGILAVIQIFPRGFQIITITKNTTIMTNLTRSQSDMVMARPEQLPEMILPTSYRWNGTTVVVTADPNRNPDDLGPFTDRIDANGNMLDPGSNILGNWGYLSGANNFRRIIGEGGPVPAPRRVGGLVGGLMILQFAPIVYNPNYSAVFDVYGNDMVKRPGDPPPTVRRSYEYYLNNDEAPNAEVWIPQDPLKIRSYRLAMSAWIDNGTRIFRRDITDAPIDNVPVGTGYINVQLSTLAGLSGPETLVGVEYSSVKVARMFEQVLAFTGDPYEYQLLDDTLGLILFNPRGYNYVERRTNNRRIPLTARVNYDVYDWRIIRDEFRVADTAPTEQRLKLGNLRHLGGQGADGLSWPGLNVNVSDETGGGGTENRAFLILDLETGGIYSKDSFTLDGSIGLVTFKDSDNNPANGVQGGIVLPGQTTPTIMTISGRSVRCLYSAVGEWAVQVSKAAATYQGTLGTVGIAQYYAGGSGLYYAGVPSYPGESPTRIYFPPMDNGKKVTISEVWYDTAGGGEPKCLRNQDYVITNSPIDAAVGLPYVDIRSQASDALAINYTRYGVGVRSVRGASVTVRTLWNPAEFILTNDEPTNLLHFEQWGQNFRRTQTDSFMTKEASQ